MILFKNDGQQSKITMISKTIPFCTAINLGMLVMSSAFANDEFRPGVSWLDTDGVHIDAHGGAILCESNMYYWFGELQNGGRQRLPAVSVLTSTDLYHWTNGGAVLTRSTDTNSDFRCGCTVERPKVLHNPKTSKYVMWFHLELAGHGYNAARVAIAISDTVTGPGMSKVSGPMATCLAI
jgi:hypothetical protein